MPINGYPADPSSGSSDAKFVVWEPDSTLTNDRVIAAGNNITFSNDGTNLTISAVGGAPTTASYVTINTEPSLPAERRLAAGNGVTVTDNGVNSTVDIGVSSSITGATFITVNAETILTGERRLTATTPLQTTDNGANSTFVVSIASGLNTQVLTASSGAVIYSYGPSIGLTRWSGGGSTSLAATDNTRNVCDCTGGSFTFTLPAPATCFNKTFSFKKTDASANTVTISAGASTLDGVSSYVVAGANQSTVCYSDGTVWLIE